MIFESKLQLWKMRFGAGRNWNHLKTLCFEGLREGGHQKAESTLDQ